MTLMRIWDNRRKDDVHSFPKLFGLLTSDGQVRDDVRTMIESWHCQSCHQDEFGDHIELLEKNAKHFDELTRCETVEQIRTLRHKFLAHNATGRTSEFPKHEFLDNLVDESISIFENVAMASLLLTYSFETEEKFWEGLTESFGESLVAGQSAQRMRSNTLNPNAS